MINRHAAISTLLFSKFRSRLLEIKHKAEVLLEYLEYSAQPYKRVLAYRIAVQRALFHNSLYQVFHTLVALSPSSLIWCRRSNQDSNGR